MASTSSTHLNALPPEADFARKSLNEGEEVPLLSPEAIEAFKMLRPSYRKKKIEEMGITEDEWYAKQFEARGDKPPPLETTWAGPVVIRQIPPRDWLPRGLEVDRKELKFLREAHKLMAERVWLEDLDKDLRVGEDAAVDKMCLERFKVFLKQYNEWVEANKDRLEEESYKDFYPGRGKRGNDYEDGMYELPFYYPGMICEGTITTLHLYQGAFVDIGGVHEGWDACYRRDHAAKDIEKKHKELKNEMVQFADNDPATLEAMRTAIEVAHQSANRWTDNIFTLRQWCSNNFPQAKEQLEHLYTEAGITDDFDYIELPSFPLSSSHEADIAS